MTNADKFKSLFGIYATELWSMPEKDFLKWLNSEVSNYSESPNGWIPCTPETMPEEHEWLGTKKFGTTISDEVYVTFENPNGERFCKHLSFQNGELSHHDKHCIDVCCKGSKPIAWMPLPPVYRGDEK